MSLSSVSSGNNQDCYRYATFEETIGKVPMLVIEETVDKYRKHGDSRTCCNNGGLHVARLPMLLTAHVLQ